MQSRELRLFAVIFTASGFAGLIYESIWTHYLKLFLGHAAYAQALVLAIFMGGMAIGSLLCSRYSSRIKYLLLAYAAAELVLGLVAVVFHPLYVQFLDTAYALIIPALSSSASVIAFKWISASLLILPQSILLGMTFPLMSAGLVRRYPQATGSILALLYFTNSMGAALGVLAAGFLFIGWVGLPGTQVIAGLINVVVAGVIWLEHKRSSFEPPAARQPEQASAPSAAGGSVVYRSMLVIALLTGLSSFIYEIGWIRMLSLVLGSSTHAFELMLSAFITGIALGGLWIKRRIDALDDQRHFLARVQIAMGLLALATLPLYSGAFHVMSWLIRSLPRSAEGYLLFNVSSHGIAMAIMVPAAFCAGMTLPLITAILLRSGTGERSIGAVYGFNTIGSILGVLIAVHLAMPLLGLKGMIILGSVIDIALGIALARWALRSWLRPVQYAAVSLALLLVTGMLVNFDPNTLSSGVFRDGLLNEKTGERTLFHRDGKSATVSITAGSQYMSIRTNGKPDASLQVAGIGHTPDESTMIFAGALGPILRPEARTAAIIGWGSGLTTNTILAAPTIARVDTIEIEPEMVNAARLFGARVQRAYDDPRSHLHIDDAKSYFAFNRKKFDMIISEPSNPWVSGVSGLFSSEFYFRIRSYLNENGLLIQWMHAYEIDPPLIASIMKALAENFSDYVIYAANNADMLIVATPSGTVGSPRQAFLTMPELLGELRRIGIHTIRDIDVRMVGNKLTHASFFADYPITTNSDYAPVVDLYAVRSRFFQKTSIGLISSPELDRLPVLSLLGKRTTEPEADKITYSRFIPLIHKAHSAAMMHRYFLQGTWTWDHPDNPLTDDMLKSAILVKQILTRECATELLRHEWWRGMHSTTASIAPYLSEAHLDQFITSVSPRACAEHFTVAQRDFISLIKAVRKMDPKLMSQYASDILVRMEKQRVDADILEYVLSVGMLGNLASGKQEAAHALWSKYMPLLPQKNAQSIAMRLLASHAVL